MPKNAVQRLKKIDNDIKTVLSIYDIANSSNAKDVASNTQKEREVLLFSKINTAKCWETGLLLDKLRDQTGQSPSLLFDSLKQFGTFIPQLEHRLYPRESLLTRKRNFITRKSSSAPSSSSTLSTICESDYKWQQSSESINSTSENSSGLKANSINVAKWIDSNSFPGERDAFLTSRKTLLTTNEILNQNNYPKREKNNGNREKNPMANYQPSVPYVLGNITAKNQTKEVKTKDILDHLESDLREATTSNVDCENAFLNQYYSTSPAKQQSPHKSLVRDSHLPIKTFGYKICRDTPKTKILPDIFPTFPVISKKIQRSEKSVSPESKIRFKSRSRGKEFAENQEKGLDTTKIEGWSTEKQKKNYVADKQEKRNRSVSERERKINSEKTQKSPELNDVSKIIEKSNEKLEKMKVSKELALDIAKHLKNKYDEIQQSKEELLEKLKTVESDNERLNNEVKNAQESTVKLQLKMEGLRQNSKTKLQEQEVKTKELSEENARLKVKITELEMQHSEMLLEKQNQIDKLQKERLSEIRNELKSRENQAEDLQRLANEKAKLVARIEELQSELKNRQIEAESQEQEIFQLQEELQKQQQELTKKTERLEETNKELKSIKKNSNDLEEQVKTLRKNVENFDDMHKKLVKQSTDYEHQMKLNQEEIQTLQNENLKLKIELENEKDAHLIKTKIIEDQQETIRQLREKLEESKTLLKRNESLERVLNVERDEKLELQEAVERLKWRKEELKRRIKTLESDLLLAPQEVVKDLQKTQMVLHELENQVHFKQKEWELHLQALIREKEQACSVAEFATKKLMQTTSEFQKQSEAHKKLHRILAENLAEKERRLREAIEKVSANSHTYAQIKSALSNFLFLVNFNNMSDLKKKASDISLDSEDFCSESMETFP